MDTDSFLESLRQFYLGFSPHTSECGLRITTLSADQATLELPSREDWLGDIDSGRFNPGIISVLVDSTAGLRSEEHTSELQSLMRISYAVFCLKKKNIKTQ